MQKKEIMLALEIFALAFVIAVTFLTAPRECQAKDVSGVIHTMSCSVINKYENLP